MNTNQLPVFLFFLLLAAPWGVLPAQTYTFDQYAGNRKVGVLTADRKHQGDREVINITSVINTKMVFTIDIRYEMETVFENGVMQQSEVTVYRNGKLKERSLLQREGRRYRCEKDGSVEWLDHPGVTFTSASLYFSPPRGVEEVFSEQYIAFNPIRYEKDGAYRMDPVAKNQPNRYTYQEGQLTEVEIGHWFANLTLKRASASPDVVGK